jgi:hypothetical protein
MSYYPSGRIPKYPLLSYLAELAWIRIEFGVSSIWHLTTNISFLYYRLCTYLQLQNLNTKNTPLLSVLFR